jgi:hypothetical protein
MFPIEFPIGVLGRNPAGVVVDPFCGRGTTNLAARAYGLPTVGVDSSPVAVAATVAKLPRGRTSSLEIQELAAKIISANRRPRVPSGEFWSMAYDHDVLVALCALRSSLLQNCRTDTARALRGLVLGALHGPCLRNGGSSYFSNQAPRTYAPKPRYAVRYWKFHRSRAPKVDVVDIIRRRAERAFGHQFPSVQARVKLADSRTICWQSLTAGLGGISWIITSPPYYGLKTYRQDQWLREWFLGGPSEIQYDIHNQVRHSRPEAFAEDLRIVWRSLREHVTRRARLVFRFGSINDRPIEARSLAVESIRGSGWRVETITCAGFSTHGKRQAKTFSNAVTPPVEEFDVWCRPC